MRYILSLSGGMSSAVAAERAIARYGRSNVLLWFANTLWEDEDLYRFLGDCLNRWGGELLEYRDGRKPLEVAEAQNIIPNSRIAPCTQELKIKPFRRFITAQPKPLTVLVGLDWKETHRHEAPRRSYGTMDGVSVDFPLMWAPLEYRPYAQVIREMGIEPPRLYALGFPHNNCGGRCVRQGVREWLRLRDTFPSRFAEVKDWENEQRSKGDARANYSIAKTEIGGTTQPLTLEEIEKRQADKQAASGMEDMFSCFCSTE